jgi:flagellar biosynthesis protein FlhF
MKIIRHTARDMRQALRAVREQLGEDAVILSSRRTGEGVEVTAAVDFDAATLEGSGFSSAPLPPQAPARIIDATPVPFEPPAATAPARRTPAALESSAARNQTALRARSPAELDAGDPTDLSALASRTPAAATRLPAAKRSAAGLSPAALDSSDAPSPDSFAAALRTPAASNGSSTRAATTSAAATRLTSASGTAAANAPSGLSPSAFALMTGRAPPPPTLAASAPIAAPARIAVPNTSYHDLAAVDQPEDYDDGVTFTSQAARYAAYEADLISEAAREAVVEHMVSDRAPVLEAAPTPAAQAAAPARATAARAQKRLAAPEAIEPEMASSYEEMAADDHDPRETDPVEEIREATLTPLASNEVKATFAEFKANAGSAPASPAAAEAMSDELKTLRRMLENQLAHLAWNDLTRRAPVHTEILRELTEIGISHDLAEHLVRQLPEDQDLTFARRFTIAGLSQYLKVTGDRWLNDGGRVAFVGATGVGKTTTLAKIAVRWVLRHGPRDIALVAADPVRIGAHDQLRSLAQLLGVPVYTPENFDQLPALLSRLGERLILIDTPGSSARDAQLAGRLAVLSTSASKLETALVLAASTQAGAIEETVRRFAPANPACCVITKLDEAASLGGVLSALIRARMPVSYMSEGQRVPEDLRPARALELVSAAVRLAKARGAAADEDLLRRRFGKTAHGIS